MLKVTNLPDGIFSTAEGRQLFWDTYNKPFLDEAILAKRGFKFFDDPNSNLIYDKQDPSRGLNFFGREVEYLKSKGYTIKDGYALPPTK